MIRFLTLVIVLFTVAACSVPSLDEVLSDTRTEYQKSKTLPPLDVPPDLSTTESDGSMSIPGEGKSTATLKEYENRNKHQSQTVAAGSQAVQQSNNTTAATAAVSAPAPVPVLDADGGSLITMRGDKTEVWNRLRGFITAKGYQLALDDNELGYMETQWSAPIAENGRTYRYKFKIYSEAVDQPGVTALYVDNEQQEQVAQGNGNLAWAGSGKNSNAERMMVGDIIVNFNGQTQQQSQPQTTTAAAVASPAAANGQGGLAQIQDLGNNKILLAVPAEYTLAWRKTGEALQRAGLAVNGSDQDKGLYHITYRGAREEATGWTAKLKKLKFWGKDEKKGTPYQNFSFFNALVQRLSSSSV